MQASTVNGGNSVMKIDPFFIVGSFFATGVGAIERGYPVDFMIALATGTLIALCHSLWKSKQRKADGIDTSLWAMIAVIGSFSLSFFVAPSLENKVIPFVEVTVTLPMAAFLICLTATPFIEWMLSGEAFKLFKKLVDRWVGEKEKST